MRARVGEACTKEERTVFDTCKMLPQVLQWRKMRRIKPAQKDGQGDCTLNMAKSSSTTTSKYISR